MSICCSFKITTVLTTRSYSLPTFTKHLTPIKTATTFYITNLSNKKTLTTCRSSNSTNHIETLTSLQKEQISLYVDALLQWNQKMNLTAVAERDEVMERHVEDSLAIIPPIQSFYLSHCNSSCDNLNLIDVGSGAGLPGLIFTIARPGQSAGHSLQRREVFDVAVGRAVAEMRVLAEYCLPLVRVGGLFVAAKGHDPQEEVKNAEKAIRMLGASMLQMLPGGG